MSTDYCCVPFCTDKNKVLHKFPIPDKKQPWKTIVFKIWVYRALNAIIKDEDEIVKILKYSRICDSHFSDSCKLPPYNKLKRASLPTLHLPNFTEESNEINCQFTELQHCSDSEEIKIFGGYQPREEVNIHTQNSQLESFENIDQHSKADETFFGEMVEPENKTLKKPYFKSLKVYFTSDKSVSEVCRICFCTLHTENMIKLYNDNEEEQNDSQKVKEMVKEVLPDLDLEVFENSVICTKCNDLLISSFELKLAWLTTEKKLQKIIENEMKNENKNNANLVLVAGSTKNSMQATEHDHDYIYKRTAPLRTYSSKKKIEETDDINLNSTTDFTEEMSSFVPGNVFEETKIIERKKTLDVGPFLCEICGQIYGEKGSLKKHIRRHQIKLERQKELQRESMCEACGEIFSSVPELRKHTQRKHRKFVKRYPQPIVRCQCEICHKVLLSKYSLQTHIRHVHLGLYNYVQCHLCGKQFTSKNALRAHLRIHTNQKRYSCDICGKKFFWLPSLKKHLLKHSDSKVECEVCGKTVKYESTLRQHIKIFHLNEGKTNCEFCGKPYWKKYDLIRHKIKVHGMESEHDRTTEQV